MAKKRKVITRQRPSPSVLYAVWEHFVYEVEMLAETGRLLTTFKADPSNSRDRVMQNALIEAFAVHARALVAFLYPSSPKPDDVTADDFFSDPSTWRSRRPTMPSTLARIHPRVGKEIAHLTYARTTVLPKEKEWPFVQIVIDIMLALQEFSRLLPDHFPRPAIMQGATPSNPAPGLTSTIGTTSGVTPIVTHVGSKSVR